MLKSKWVMATAVGALLVGGCAYPGGGSSEYRAYETRGEQSVRFGVVEAINGNIRMLINRGRGYKDMRYLLLKARRMAVTNTEYVAFQKIRKAA